ncbi:MAG: hypothetical protein Q4F77_11050 [Acinetobacter sp.]|uniref:hypothetical protein n=1 Tax=Acinetobacter sp. TaxID=472 RepID=UPI0026DFAF7F|nr:hypothetical protein [Acinetobacter sp.]MDO5543832.1 hypothetical protein [Acinetobacter sp.]
MLKIDSNKFKSMEVGMLSDNILKKIEYQDFEKFIKISSISLVVMILFIYFGQFFKVNKFIFFIDVIISVFFVSSLIVSIIKSVHLIKIINLDVKDNYEHKKLRNFISILFLLSMFTIGVALMFLQTNYRVSANILSIFFMSIPLLSFYFLCNKNNK